MCSCLLMISSCKLWFCLGCSWYLLSVILLLFEDMYIMAIYLYDHFISETERMKMMLRLHLHLVGWFWKASPSTFLESKFWTPFIELLGPKWPISMNVGNIWAWNTVCVIISYLPLFGVLELGELEYHIFLIHSCWHGNFN